MTLLGGELSRSAPTAASHVRDGAPRRGNPHRGDHPDDAPTSQWPAALYVLIHTREDGWALMSRASGGDNSAWTALDSFGASPCASPQVAQTVATARLAECGVLVLAWQAACCVEHAATAGRRCCNPKRRPTMFGARLAPTDTNGDRARLS